VLILDGKTDLNQISLTGVRAITMIGLLMTKPHSLEEIREKFIDYKIMNPSHSDDILRIDLNTIKSMGCEVSRSSPKTEYKYVLSKHPFGINISSEDITMLKKSFDKIKSVCDIPTLLKYDKLIKKIAEHITNEKTKEEFMGISPIIGYNSDLINDLNIDCKFKNTIELMYKKPTSKSYSKKRLIAQELLMRNNKIYLFGYDSSINKTGMFNTKRISKILSRELTQNIPENQNYAIKFVIKDFGLELLSNEEKVVGEQDNGMLVAGTYFNRFIAFQRVMSLGPKCVVKEPLEFKNLIVSKLKEMRTLYEKKE